MFKRIDHIEIIPSNFEKSLEFYEKVLGFNLKQEQQVNAGPLKKVVYLQLGDTVLELLDVKNPSPKLTQQFTVGYRAMAIEVENMEKTIDYFNNKGIDITWGPVDLGKFIRAEIQDPDGNSLELREWKQNDKGGKG